MRLPASLLAVAFGFSLGSGAFFAVSALGPAAAHAAPAKRPPAKTTRARPARGAATRRVAAKKPQRRTVAKRTVKRGKRREFLEVRVPAMKGQLPNVQAQGSIVVDLDSGQELFTRQADVPRPIASISKLAATLVAMEHNLELEGLTTINKVDLQVARGGAQSRLFEGMILTNRDLLHAALLGSDNRAVSALGRAVGLGASQFAAAMTKKAAQLGLKHTRFREPTGLSPENQSTPRETIAMLREVMKHPVLGPIARKSEYDAHPVSRPPIHYVSTNRPAARSNVTILGGKTGYNDSARYCLVLAARVDGRNLGMAFLGTEGKMTRFGDVARVADWVIVHKPKPTPANTAIAGRTGSPPSLAGGPPGADPTKETAKDTSKSGSAPAAIGAAVVPARL